ncbi:MAG: extracellular solute-binding protein [Ruminococcaceae bacterium]|nr:extracellular solute-binding protein [Oscillospiraceae bacterium]
MKKLIVAFLLIFALSLCLVACGEGSSADESGQTSATKPTDEPTVLPDERPTDDSTATHVCKGVKWTVTKEATCANKGEKSFVCECGEVVETEEIATLSHTPGAEATCTTAQTCTVCSAELVKALGHTPGAEATCTTAQICTVCNTTLVGIKGHTPAAEVSCTATQNCIDCGVVLMPAKGHTPGAEATCTTAQTCTVCSAELVKALGHTPGAEATCTTAQICTVCNTTLVGIKGHTPETEVSCTATQNCIDCGVVLAPAKGHTPGAEATCTTAQTCVVCQAELVKALGHTPGAEATCTTAQTCTVCKTELVKALGHTPGAEATCTTAQICTVCNITLAGIKGHTPETEVSCTATQNCIDCGAVLMPAKGHTPGAEATCTTAQTCVVCQTELAPAFGHTPGAHATCITAQVCTVCGVELDSAFGHLYLADCDTTCNVCGIEREVIAEHIYADTYAANCSLCRAKNPITYDGGEVTITFYHTMNARYQMVLDKYIDKFNQMYPNITVKHTQAGGYDEVRDQIKADIVNGTQPNIAYCYPDHVAIYNIAKAAVPLDSLINSEIVVTDANGNKTFLGLTDEQKADFIPAFYEEGAVYDDVGTMYTLPMSKYTEVLYYNKDFFTKHNLTVPTTWEEMEALCERIKEIDPNCIPLGYDSEGNWFINMCAQYNSPYTSNTGNHILFNNNTNRSFVKMMSEWYAKGYVTTQELYGGYTSGLFTELSGKKCYMSIGSTGGAIHQCPSRTDYGYAFDVGIAPIPQMNPEEGKILFSGPSLCILDSEDQQEVIASWLFMEFLTTNKEFQAEFSMISGYMPVIKSVDQVDAYKNFIAGANGGSNIQALAVKVARGMSDCYFTPDAFVGSDYVRYAVGYMVAKCMSGYTEAADKDAFIRKIFDEYYQDCISYVGEGESTTDDEIYAAAEFLDQLYKDLYHTENSYDVISCISMNGKSYDITWSSSSSLITLTDNHDGSITVNIPGGHCDDIYYTLTASLSDGNGNVVIKKFALLARLAGATHSEYIAAQSGDSIIVKGIVTGIVSKSNGATSNCLYLQDIDKDGGYYIYGMTEDPIAMGIEIGMTVRASGTKDIYNGTHEVKPNDVKIVSTEKTAVTPIDITEAYQNAEDLKAQELFNLQGALVTIKGVEITDQTASSGYYNFVLAGKTSYIRISSSTCAINKADQTTFAANHTANRGNTADATGIVCVYNGAIYLVPVTVDAFSNFQLAERTDAEKVEYEAGNITVDSAIHSNKTITLPVVGATYSNVTISWVSDNACAVVDGGNITFTLQDEAQTVKLTATITLGENTATKEFTITVDAKPTVVPSVVETPAADTAYKFFVAQNNLGQTLYLDGGVDGRYLTTTTDVTEAIDVYAEAVDGGFKFYILVDGAKQYIEVYNNAENKLSVQYNAEGASVYTYNAETDAWATTFDGKEYYLGTYSTFATVSASAKSYINAGNTHASQFPMELATLVDIADCAHVYSGD